MRLFCNRSQMTSKCGKNKKVPQDLSSLPSLVFLRQRPRKAEKRDLGNEVDYLIDTKLVLKANAVFNIFIRCSSWCSADALGQCVPVGSGISHTWWPACFACTTWNGKPLTGAPLINKQNEFFKTFPCCFTFRNFRAYVPTYFQSSMLLRTFDSFGGIPA